VYATQHITNLKGVKSLHELFTDTKCTSETKVKIIYHFPTV